MYDLKACFTHWAEAITMRNNEHATAHTLLCGSCPKLAVVNSSPRAKGNKLSLNVSQHWQNYVQYRCCSQGHIIPQPMALWIASIGH
jgi:hypothetical protein